MRGSVHGRKILTVGPRLALVELETTAKLDSLVKTIEEFTELVRTRQLLRLPPAPTTPPLPPPQQPPLLEDIRMEDVTSCAMLSNSWVVIPGEDWEMVDCAAA
jgi:hypothetical protein